MIEPIWIDEQVALVIHERLISLHGGASGVRDKELLKSALARPLNLLAYDQQADVIHLAAAYTAGILQIILLWMETNERVLSSEYCFLSLMVTDLLPLRKTLRRQ